MARVVGALVGVLVPVGASGQEGEAEAINHSEIAFTLAEKDLLPENVAFDPVTGAFFVGSTRFGKVVRVAPDGARDDFLRRESAGLWMVIGMKVDAARRHLWLASSGGDNLVGYDPPGARPAGIFRFDVDTGAPLGRWTLESDEANHFFNDLVVTSAGDVYATHMFDEAGVYRIRAATGALELFSEPSELSFPNGIALDPGERFLYVAHSGGIMRIALADAATDAVSAEEPSWLTGVDGVYAVDGGLVLVRPSQGEVSRVDLSSDGLRVIGRQVLERAHPMFGNPTTGVVVGDSLYYVANAQFGQVGEGGTLPAMTSLYQPVILRVPIRPGAGDA